MNMALGRSYRLAARGGAGLVCDQNGVTLGAVDLVRTGANARSLSGFEVRSLGEIGYILRAAYGPQPDEVVMRLHRGLHRTAAWLAAGDLGRAGLEAVMLRLPELTAEAMAKLSEVADLEKGGAAWENEPRVPAGQAGGGQWTTDGGAAATRPAANAGGASATSADCEGPRLPLDDGVYRPGVDRPLLVPTGADEEEQARFGSNGAPDDPISLEQVFPGLRDARALEVPLAPIDGFLGISAMADAANLDGTMLLYRDLIAQIKTVKPNFEDDELLPPGGIAGLSWRGRTVLLNDLRMQRAAAFYNVRGDVGPLQVETLRFLHGAVDSAYAEGVREYNVGRIQPQLSREVAIGNYMDREVRFQLRVLFNTYRITFGPGSQVTINNRDYDTSGPAPTYRVPDARIGDVSYDWTLGLKTISSPQIRGFFSADSSPSAVVVIRPSQLGPNSTYAIRRPEYRSPRR